MGLASGFEQAVVMDLTGGKSEAVTRTLANVIMTRPNVILNQQWTIQNILKPGHDCSTIMDWGPTRDKIPSDISFLLSKISPSFHS